MSEFDKEAEREKLREKFERDKQKRQATERMSELLLKGATMTNTHCQNCGDPVFRQDGQEFCPSCGAGTEAAQAEQRQSQQAQQAQQAQQGQQQSSEPTPEEPKPEEQPSADVPQSSPESVEQPKAPGPGPTQSEPPQPEPAPKPPASEPRTSDDEADLAAARASLARTLTRMAERAENAEDPRSAKAYLEAAKEAAETLDALR